jgi:catechol 2,3-dioxygenase-like lactoylglutathione lyase family enzyme
MPNVDGLSHVVINVIDLDKMVAFYQEHLGLTITHGAPGRMIFMTPDPEVEDHQIALAKGREGDGNVLAHIAWHVPTVADVKAYYEHFKAAGVPIHHCVSHAYATLGNTVSCYFLDPEGNRLEVFAMVDADPEHERSGNYGLDLDQSVEDITAQAMRLTPAAAH